MSNTVDLMITNAIARAINRGVAANSYAENALFGVDAFIDKFSPPLIAKVAKPPKYATLPKLPASPSASELEAFKAALNAVLNEYFARYFSMPDAYASAEAWVIATLRTGNPKLPGASFDLIWDRAQQNTQALGNDLSGLDLPAVTPTTHNTPAYLAFTHAKAYARSVANVELWIAAVSSRIKNLRMDAIAAAGNYIKARMAVGTTVAEAQTSLLQAQAALKKAAADWYIAQLSPRLRDSERRVTSLTEDRSIDVTSANALTERALIAADAAIKGADAVATIAQAAQSSLNSVVNASQVGF